MSAVCALRYGGADRASERLRAENNHRDELEYLWCCRLRREAVGPYQLERRDVVLIWPAASQGYGVALCADD